MTRITLPTSALHDLIVPVLPHAAVKDDFALFNTVRLEITNDTLYAAASDRYTVAVSRRPLDDPTPDAAITVPRDLAANALKTFKFSRDEDPALTLDIDDRLRIDDTTAGVRLDIPAAITEPEPGAAPVTVTAANFVLPWRQLLGKVLHRSRASTASGVGLNPAFAKRWDAARRYGVPLRFLPGPRSTDAVLVVAGEHFAGLWMPVRVSQNEDGPADWLKDTPWCDEIAKPEPKPETAA